MAWVKEASLSGVAVREPFACLSGAARAGRARLGLGGVEGCGTGPRGLVPDLSSCALPSLLVIAAGAG